MNIDAESASRQMFASLRMDRAILQQLNTDISVVAKRPKEFTVFNYAHFIELSTLERVVKGKAIFDKYPTSVISDARNRSNPYELIGSSIFMNRAAMKLAEIDATFNFPITQPACYKAEECEPLYFGDLCGGCGGFTEYILWRLRWKAKGFGMTLRDDDGYKPNLVVNGPSEMFRNVYGPSGDGDITKMENVNSYCDFVKDGTNGALLHSFVSDGGFSVLGHENEQEVLTRELYFYQVLIGLKVLREGGNLVMKLFDTSTPFTASLLLLVQKCFRNMCIYKPFTSRPANGERYMICLHRERDDIVGIVISYLEMLAPKVSQYLNSTTHDLKCLLPIKSLIEDRSFLSYLTRTVERLAERQITHLTVLYRFVNDRKLVTKDQEGYRESLLRKWKVPEGKRGLHVYSRPCDLFPFYREVEKLLGTDFLLHSPAYTEPVNASEALNRQNGDMFFIPALGNLELIVACGGGVQYTFKLDDYPSGFKDIPEIKRPRSSVFLRKVALPQKTILLAERVTKVSSESVTSLESNDIRELEISYRLLDAFVIGGDYMLEPLEKDYFEGHHGVWPSERRHYSYRYDQMKLLLGALHDKGPLGLARRIQYSGAKYLFEHCTEDDATTIVLKNQKRSAFNGFRLMSKFA